MELLFKREQTPGKIKRVNFTLWGKIELNDDENEIVNRYKFDEAVLIEAIQPTLLRTTALLSLGVFVLIFMMVSAMGSAGVAFMFGLVG
ncbi:MAG: hypothetical protein GWN81_19165, partial [Phycisphaerae bacterium]|nr:hypothetical protein [Phycisphaerae bacterium]NIP54587.1 hypothetical protein [Phycisphaerae bacterium]NIU10912.1 hypothetical protein [Phycisphaerae bacterium]NIX00959.1 hypothetical protein [Phycisphaerae bacterium]NIX30610.1 hypothetical protein [Phycisphaerae bacterium]